MIILICVKFILLILYSKGMFFILVFFLRFFNLFFNDFKKKTYTFYIIIRFFLIISKIINLNKKNLNYYIFNEFLYKICMQIK